jgi:hypothetical protein
MGGVGRETAQDNVVLKAKLQDLQRLMRPEAVANQYAWFAVELGCVEISPLVIVFLVTLRGHHIAFDPMLSELI